jgi:uncharacterized protein YodC (DUF2158 family)
MIKPGDIVIKKTGGNKMLAYENKSGIVSCCWCVGEESCFNEFFREEDLVLIDDFEKIMKMEERQDRIESLFKN